MGKKDLTDMLGGGGGRTRQKYRCKADGCQVTPMGVNLAKHYMVNTDWVLLKDTWDQNMHQEKKNYLW